MKNHSKNVKLIFILTFIIIAQVPITALPFKAIKILPPFPGYSTGNHQCALNQQVQRVQKFQSIPDSIA
jgi:hypothetical protein